MQRKTHKAFDPNNYSIAEPFTSTFKWKAKLFEVGYNFICFKMGNHSFRPRAVCLNFQVKTHWNLIPLNHFAAFNFSHVDHWIVSKVYKLTLNETLRLIFPSFVSLRLTSHKESRTEQGAASKRRADETKCNNDYWSTSDIVSFSSALKKEERNFLWLMEWENRM